MTFSSLKTVTKRLSLAVTVLLFTLFVVSCANPTQNNNGDILGTWTSSYGEIYAITGSTFTSSFLAGGIPTVFYGGNNLFFSPEDTNSGYIYFRYTKAYYEDDVGRWYAVHYENLTSNSVSLAGAATTSTDGPTETLYQAIAKFTVENGYFGIHSDCAK